ncbi:MAG: YitT family protein [Clostridia bacterium]|nr:YitT family protein [Clostridia bacterium]
MIEKTKKSIVEYCMIIGLAFCMALIYEVLIFPNSFAPAGINGLATIIQHLFGFSVGYMSIIINIPLIVIVFLTVDKEFALKTLCYVLIFSFFTLIMKNGDVVAGKAVNGDGEGLINLSAFAYKNTSVSTILAPIASGALNGLIYGFCVRHNSCTGGTDVIARMVRVKRPELNIMWVTFALNSFVAVLSYFAYGEDGVFNLEPVLLCVMYCFVSSKMGDTVLKGYKTALKFEVVTSYPEEISQEIIKKLKHSATVVHAQGMYTHQDKALLICVVNKNQIVDFENIIRKYDGTFAYITSVNETVGNFKIIKKTNTEG